MPYVAHSPTNAGSFIEVDDFASSFNGSNVAFTLQVGGVDITPNQQNLLVVLDGVLQMSASAYSVSGSTITFTEAPANGVDLYCVLMGQSASIGQGTIGADELKVSGNGSNGQVLVSDGDGTFSWATDSEPYLPLAGGTMSGAINLGSQNITNGGTITGTFVGNITGNVTGNTSGTAATVTGAAQTNITSVGTLTSLTLGGDLLVPQYIKHVSDTDCHIEFGTDEVKLRTGDSSRLIARNSNVELYSPLVATSATFGGSVGIGITNPTDYNASADDLVIGGTSGAHGMTIVTATGSTGYLFFADGTSGDSQYEGGLQYDHSTDELGLYSAGSIKMRIASNGAFRIGGDGSDQTTKWHNGSAYVNAKLDVRQLAIAFSGTDKITSDTSGNITFAGNLTIPEFIYHSGDTDTFIRFTDNKINFVSGNSTALELGGTVSGNTFRGTNTFEGLTHLKGSAWNNILKLGDTSRSEQLTHMNNGSVNFSIYTSNGTKGVLTANHDGSAMTLGADYTSGTLTVYAPTTFTKSLTVDTGGTSVIYADGNNNSGDDGRIILKGHTSGTSRAYAYFNNGVSSGGFNWYLGCLRGSNAFTLTAGNDDYPGYGGGTFNDTVIAVDGNRKIGIRGNPGSEILKVHGNFAATGSVSKGSGSFKIDHPLPSKKDTHHLVHSFVESPRADLIYRDKVKLVKGKAIVNIDKVAGMTEGTFVLLCDDVQCFTSNESDWDAVKGSVKENILTIECQNSKSTANVSWMVVADRKDQHMMDTNWTDKNGKPIIEPLKETALEGD